MNINDFEPGQVVQLDIKMDSIKGNFNATVAMLYKNLLLLEPIFVNRKLIGFPKECSVNLTYTLSDVYFVWQDIDIKTIIYQNHYYHAATLYGDAEPINRRNNYRVYIGEDMQVTYFTDEGPKNITALIKDISETGFAFISKEHFTTERTVRINIPQPDRTVIHLSAKIVRTIPMEDDGRTLYGCQFLEKSPHLNQYLMRVQRMKQYEKNNKQ